MSFLLSSPLSTQPQNLPRPSRQEVGGRSLMGSPQAFTENSSLSKGCFLSRACPGLRPPKCESTSIITSRNQHLCLLTERPEPRFAVGSINGENGGILILCFTTVLEGPNNFTVTVPLTHTLHCRTLIPTYTPQEWFGVQCFAQGHMGSGRELNLRSFNQKLTAPPLHRGFWKQFYCKPRKVTDFFIWT